MRNPLTFKAENHWSLDKLMNAGISLNILCIEQSYNVDEREQTRFKTFPMQRLCYELFGTQLIDFFLSIRFATSLFLLFNKWKSWLLFFNLCRGKLHELNNQINNACEYFNFNHNTQLSFQKTISFDGALSANQSPHKYCTLKDS